MLSSISDNDCARNYGSGQLAPRIAFFELKNRLQNARKARFFMQLFVIQVEALPDPEVRMGPGGKKQPPRRGGTAILSIDENTR